MQNLEYFSENEKYSTLDFEIQTDNTSWNRRSDLINMKKEKEEKRKYTNKEKIIWEK